jgi:uncharacterized protein HemX
MLNPLTKLVKPTADNTLRKLSNSSYQALWVKHTTTTNDITDLLAIIQVDVSQAGTIRSKSLDSCIGDLLKQNLTTHTTTFPVPKDHTLSLGQHVGMQMQAWRCNARHNHFYSQHAGGQILTTTSTC